MIEDIIEYRTELFNPINELTEVKPSPIQGLGLFAKEFIPKGTIWWAASEPGDVLLVHREQYSKLDGSVESSLISSFKHAILIYSYYVRRYDALVLCLDNARFVNHSFTPNSGAGIGPNFHPLSSIALRDIEPGEEILEDYTAYDQCPWAMLYEGFLVR